MAVLMNKDSRVLIQGFGGAGQREAKTSIAYGTQVVAGVTPGRGGQTIEGVPIYNTVEEAVAAHTGVECTVGFVGFALGAGVGLGLAVSLLRVRLLERSLVPILVASQTVPIVAVAPVIVVGLKAGWFGIALVAEVSLDAVGFVQAQKKKLKRCISKGLP